jgi:hypothetical protein
LSATQPQKTGAALMAMAATFLATRGVLLVPADRVLSAKKT